MVVDFSERAIKSGQTNPTEVARMIRRGVEVYNKPDLHAKVFAFRKRGFIGSTNVSNSSAFGLQEAVVEIKNKRLLASMRLFVRRLCRDLVTLHEALQMKAIYRPPQFGRGAPRTEFDRRDQKLNARRAFTPIKVVQLQHVRFDKQEREAERQGKQSASKRVRSTRYFGVDYFLIEGSCRFKLRDIVIQVTDEGRRKKMVSPAAKVIHLEPVLKPRKKETIVFVETAKKHHRINLRFVKQRLGPKTEDFLNEEGNIMHQSFIEKLLAIWTGADK